MKLDTEQVNEEFYKFYCHGRIFEAVWDGESWNLSHYNTQMYQCGELRDVVEWLKSQFVPK